ncbi:MAG: hypothetical protein P8L85_20145 [Rubripirellula sp.]|nr:hypothetical protein [Rubripirellula sp.]
MRTFAPLVGFFILSVTVEMASPLLAADSVDYVKEVRPIFARYCIGCHTAEEEQGGLVMETYKSLMVGGESGLAVTAGEPNSSRLLQMVRGKLEPAMPPEGEERPSEDEISVIQEWIEQGALGPEGELSLKRELHTPSIRTADNVKDPITALAYSPDGERFATGRYGEVLVRDLDGNLVSNISAELHKITSVEFSQNGSKILVASGVPGAYGFAAIYSVETGEQQIELLGHRDMVYAATFSPDESIVATAGYDRDIILWDANSGAKLNVLKGHNGAVFDLVFSPNGQVLASACADETVKIWNVNSGKRLDTLSQPEGEVLAVEITPDGKFIIAGSGDSRLRVWRLRSTDQPRINPIVATRFVDESPLVEMTLTPDGSTLAVLSIGGNVKLVRTSDWMLAATLPPLSATGSDLAVTPDAKSLSISLMNGDVATRAIPEIKGDHSRKVELEPVYFDIGPLTTLNETDLRHGSDSEGPLGVSRGVEVRGAILQPGEVDRYQFEARRGEVWAIDGDASDQSLLDSIVAIYDDQQQPVLQTRLQAVRDSYFTFRGKDSQQIGDFRVFNWQEMRLDDYFFASGEVTRLFMYPRGPDSGYNVYPNEGMRWTYFGTSHTTHALGEPAYVVRPLPEGASPLANGLPVFDLYYENDDDPMRIAGTNSRLLFIAPADGMYTVAIRDTRGDGGEAYGYQLALRPANPSFKATIGKPNGSLRRGSGREFTVRVDRLDGFDGAVTFDMVNLPTQIKCNLPITIEPGQRYAHGTLWVAEDTEGWEGTVSPQVVVRGEVLGKWVERDLGSVGDLSLEKRPSAIPSIQPVGRTLAEDENWTLTVRRGETVSARVVIRRSEGFTNQVSFGNENAGRNTAHGVYVDNIGLNGLLVRQNEDEREFFLTADPIAMPGKRTFFLTGSVDGKVTTHPITVEVLP